MFLLRALRYLFRIWALRPLRLGGRRARNVFEQHSWKVVWAIIAVVVIANANSGLIRIVIFAIVAVWILRTGMRILFAQFKRMFRMFGIK